MQITEGVTLSDQDSNSNNDAFNKALDDSKTDHYLLWLYVAGNTQRSANAILSLRKLCEEHLSGRYQLEVIDIYQQPELAKTNDIIATPTLVKLLPLPLRRMIGDLSETDRILVGLNLVKLDQDTQE